MQALRHYLLAVQFFSRIPVAGRLAAWVGWSPEMQRASAAHLPGVGWLVGLWAALLLAALLWLLPASPWSPLAAALISTAGTLWLTGGFMRTAWPMSPTGWAAWSRPSARWRS
jgi:adenosylcobinamide-GDP ribazoletransferase